MYELIVTQAERDMLAMISAIIGDENGGRDIDEDMLANLLPLSVMKDISKDEADRYRKELEALGATVELRQMAP